MAWRFDGIDDYALLEDHAALSFGSAGSLGGWLCRADGSGTLFDTVFAHSAATPRWNITWPHDGAASYPGRLKFYLRDSDANSVTIYTASAVVSGVWHHAMMTWDGTTLRCYLDGSHSQTGSGDISDFVYPLNPAGSLYLGCSATVNGFVPAMMAEWAKWDRALSAAEIAILAAGKAPDWLAQGLAWYLPMRDKPVELVRGIPIKLLGAGAIDHLRRFQPASQSWAARAQGVGG